jgi:hypothetical protein
MKALFATAAALVVAMSATAANATDTYHKPQAQYVTVKTPVVTYKPETKYVPVTQYRAVTTYKPVVTYKEEQRKVYVAPKPVYQPVYVAPKPVYAHRPHFQAYRTW